MPRANFAKNVGGGRGDEEKIGALGHGDMFDGTFDVASPVEDFSKRSVITFWPLSAAKVNG